MHLCKSQPVIGSPLTFWPCEDAIEKTNKKEMKKIPKLNVKLSEPQKDITESETYIIMKAEEIVTDKSKYEAIKVTLKSTNSNDENEYATMLWQSDTIPSNSKLGSFIDAFNAFLKDDDAGYDTDNWLNHKIKVKTWRNKQREIEVIS